MSKDKFKSLDIQKPATVDKGIFKTTEKLNRRSDPVKDMLDNLASKAGESSGLKYSGDIDRVSLGPGHLSTTFQDTPNEARLIEARALILKKEYPEALEILGEILREEPAHQEGRFLKARCLTELEQAETALHIVAVLRNENPSPGLLKRIRELCKLIRDRLRGVVVEKVLVPAMFGESAAAIRKLRELIALDPEAFYYHFLLANLLLRTNQTQAATAAMEAAVAAADLGDLESVEALRVLLLNKQAAESLDPARKSFRARSYREAQDRIKQISPELQTTALAKSFLQLLSSIHNGRKSPPQYDDPSDAESLCAYLVEVEMGTAFQALEEEQYQLAEKFSRAAADLLPEYHFAAFVYAHSAYQRIGDQFDRNAFPPLDQVIKDFRVIRNYAALATADPDIKAAASLLKTIEGALEQLEEIQKENERHEREAKLFNDLAEEFMEIMKSTETGLKSAADIPGFRTKLQAVKARIPAAKKQISSAAGKEACDELVQAIDEQLKELNELEELGKKAAADGAIITPLQDRLMTHMDTRKRKGPIKSQLEASGEVAFFSLFASDCRTAKLRVSSAGAREALDELIDVANKIISQLR